MTDQRTRHGIQILLLYSAFFLFSFSSLPCPGQQDPSNLDVTLFRRINDGRSPFLDKVVNVNNELFYPVGTVAPLGFLSYGILSGSEYETDTGILASVAEIVSYGVSYGLKQIVKRPRPFVTLPNVHVTSMSSADSYSLPSGHAAGAFALATSLTLRYPKPAVYVPLHLWAMLVSYGRVYRGVHYPSDVLVGGAIGSGTAIVVHLL